MTEYPIVILPLNEEDGGGFLGYVPDLPGCLSDGESPEEAVTNTQGAILEWLDIQKHRGVEIPAPGSAAERETIREEKLLKALQSLAEFKEQADDEIKGLQRRLSELIAILKDESGRPRVEVGAPKVVNKPASRLRTH